MPDPLIYRGEVLELLGCTRMTLDSEVKSGALPPPRVMDGKLAWLESEIKTYVAALPRQRFTGKVGRPKKQAAL